MKVWEEAAAMRPNYGEEVWPTLYRRRYKGPGRPKGAIASKPKNMVMSQALHTCAGVRACLGKAVMHELSRGPGLAAAAVCTTSGLSQVAARQSEPAFGLQPYKSILQLYCDASSLPLPRHVLPLALGAPNSNAHQVTSICCSISATSPVVSTLDWYAKLQYLRWVSNFATARTLQLAWKGCLPDHLDRLHGELQLSALSRQMMAAKQEAVPQVHVDAGVWKEVARSRDVWLVNRTSHYIGLLLKQCDASKASRH
jgi:hypothetical protein